MTNVLKIDSLNRKLPSELRAIIHIFSADQELKEKALPFVNIEKQEVNWFMLCGNHFGRGHSAAIMWARSIWFQKFSPGSDLFERSTSMDLNIRKSILEALAIAWGLD